MNYRQLPPAPQETNANTILIRLIDSFGFRYYWSTEGLRVIDMQFTPSEDSMNMLDLLNHINQLAYVSSQTFKNQSFVKQDVILELNTLRESTLKHISDCRKTLEIITNTELSEAKFKPANSKVEYPFWNIINGPVADALTHIGQITTWRRTNGNPIQKHNLFLGTAN